MLTPETTKTFEKDIVELKQSGSFNIEEFGCLLDLLLSEKQLPNKYKNHPLKGKWIGFYDCHLSKNCVLVYRKDKHKLFLTRIGTHVKVLGL